MFRLLIALLLVPLVAHASAIDVADVSSELALTLGPIAAVGGAVLLLKVAQHAWIWLRWTLEF